MKKLLTIAFALTCLAVWGQPAKKSVVIGSMTSKPNALLIINPQHADQGVILPQLSTAQRLALKPSSPSEDGLIVFDTSLDTYFYWSDQNWVRLLHDKIRKTSYLSIDPAAFKELKPNDDVRHDYIVLFQSDNSFITATRDFNKQIIAPVQLPHGAEIKELKVHYMDNSDRNIKLHLVRTAFGQSPQELLRWESSGASSSINVETFDTFNSLQTIDLENYTYRLIVEFDIPSGSDVDSPDQARQRLYGVRIKYEE